MNSRRGFFRSLAQSIAFIALGGRKYLYFTTARPNPFCNDYFVFAWYKTGWVPVGGPCFGDKVINPYYMWRCGKLHRIVTPGYPAKVTPRRF